MGRPARRARRHRCGRCPTCDLEVAGVTATCCSSPACAPRSAPAPRRRHHDDRRARRSRPPRRACPDTFATSQRSRDCSSSAAAGTRPVPTSGRSPDDPPAIPPFEVVAPKAARRPAPARPRRPVLRLRGRPALHRGRRDRAGASTTCSAGSTSASSTARCGRTPSPRSGWRSRPSSISSRLHRAQHPDYAHLPLRALRAHAPADHRRPTRHARSRRRPAAARRSVRRPVPDREARAAGRIALVLDQEARAAVHGRRAARATCRRATTRSSRYVEARALARRRARGCRSASTSSTTSPTTTATTACRPCGCATGCVDHARAARPASRSPNPEPGENVYEPSRARGRAGSARGGLARRIADRPASAGCRGDRLPPARGEDLLGDALPAAARTGLAVGGDARRHRDRCRALPRARGLASPRGQERSAASSSCAASSPPARG